MSNNSKLISDAKIMLADLGMSFENLSEPSLKANEYIKELKYYTEILNANEKRSIFGKIKDVMLTDENDEKTAEAKKRIKAALSALEGCKNCKCANCVNVSSQCRCEGCISGNFITECDTFTEKRRTLPGTSYIDGREIKSSEYDRRTGRLICTVKNSVGAEEKYDVDLKTNTTHKV